MTASFLDFEINQVLCIGAVVVLLLGLFSGYISNRWAISEPIICLLVGVLISPVVFGVATPRLTEFQKFELLQQAARVTLSISVMGAALRLGPRYVETHWRALAVVLGPGMLLMWLANSAVLALLFSLPPLLILLIGAVMTPTDPVLSDTIISSQGAEQHVPHRLRSILTAESGANDGLGMLFVTLPMALIGSVGMNLSGWFPACGAMGDFGKFGSRRIHRLGGGPSLALGATSARFPRNFVPHRGRGAGVDRGLQRRTHGWGRNSCRIRRGRYLQPCDLRRRGGGRSEHIDAAITRFFDLPVFILLGFFLPWHAWAALGWKGRALPVLVLLLRRLPAWFLLQRWRPMLHAPRETAFVGWFGPVGIAALYYAAGSAKIIHDPALWALTSLVIVASILIHGSSATPVTLRFRHAHEEEKAPL